MRKISLPIKQLIFKENVSLMNYSKYQIYVFINISYTNKCLNFVEVKNNFSRFSSILQEAKKVYLFI